MVSSADAQSARKLVTAIERVAAVLLGVVGGATAYSLYAMFPPTNLWVYLGLMLLALLPLLAIAGLKRAGWKMWPRVVALLFVWFVTDTAALSIMMIISSVWVYWRALVADRLVWRLTASKEV